MLNDEHSWQGTKVHVPEGNGELARLWLFALISLIPPQQPASHCSVLSHRVLQQQHTQPRRQSAAVWSIRTTAQYTTIEQQARRPLSGEACAPEVLTTSNLKQHNHWLGKHVAATKLLFSYPREHKVLLTWYAAMRWPAASASAGVSSCSPFSSSAM